jgi:hypothetical protein
MFIIREKILCSTLISCSPIHSIDLITLTILFLFLLKWMVRIEKYLLQWIIHGRESRSHIRISYAVHLKHRKIEKQKNTKMGGWARPNLRKTSKKIQNNLDPTK